MSTRKYDFVQVDVFTRSPFKGNPLAIFTDARGLSDAEMQALAREMNLSETTFILPREPETEGREGTTVRIFTVEEELPFAGHPTLGTALYLNSLRPESDKIVLDLKVGKVPLQFRAEAATKQGAVDGQVFGEMRQRDPEFGPTLPLEKVTAAVGLPNDALRAEWPIEVVSTGLPFAILPLRSRQVLTSLKPNLAALTSLLEPTKARFFYFIAPERSTERLEVEARMFFYGGEDPATGSAAGCAASYLVEHGIAQSEETVLIRQGLHIHRASDIFVRSRFSGDKVTDVRVGGYAVEVLRGTVTI